MSMCRTCVHSLCLMSRPLSISGRSRFPPESGPGLFLLRDRLDPDRCRRWRGHDIGIHNRRNIGGIERVHGRDHLASKRRASGQVAIRSNKASPVSQRLVLIREYSMLETDKRPLVNTLMHFSQTFFTVLPFSLTQRTVLCT